MCSFAAAAMLYSCNKDSLSDTSVFTGLTAERNEFDEWLDRNYVDTYNIQFKYRFTDIESSMDYHLTPASYEQSIQMAKLVRHMCLQAYDEVTGSTDFIYENFPKIIFLVGSYAYKTTGTVVLGTAEAGTKITLYNVDNLKPSAITAKTAYFKTIHHEFGHILNQTKPYSTDFNEISGSSYIQDDWSDISEASALSAGFISSYAASAVGEDFVEILSLYINRTAEEWESMMVTAGETGRPVIESKLEIVRNYMKDSWNIDMDQLRDVVLRRAAEAPYLDFDSLDD